MRDHVDLHARRDSTGRLKSLARFGGLGVVQGVIHQQDGKAR